MLAVDHGSDDVRDTLFATAGCAVVVYLAFKQWEPWRLSIVIPLTVFPPVVLSLRLVESHGMMNATAVTFTTFFSILMASVAFYRLSPLHPLAKFHGPLQCKLTGFWMAWVASRGKRHVYIQSLHERYGDYVRIGPNEVSISDGTVISLILNSPGWPKASGMSGRALHQDPLPLISLPDDAEHARRRRSWNRAFSSAAVKEYQPIVAQRATQLIHALQEQQGVVDLAQWMSYFTYDFMGDMAFGGGTEMLRDGDQDGLWALLKDGMSTAVPFEHVPWLSHYISHFPSMIRSLTKLRTLAFGRSQTRYNKGSNTRDLFYYLSNEDRADAEMPLVKVVISDAVLAIVAGSDTTAVTLGNIFYYLISNPQAYKKLQKEVDKHYPAGEDALNPKNYSHMPYLEAVINEAMRLYPALPSGSMRTPAKDTGGQSIGHHYIPVGTQVRVHPYTIQRDPRNFSHPSLFWPDRWLIASGLLSHPEKIVHNSEALIPFSTGSRNCVGKNLALLEMKMVTCHILQRLEFRFADAWDPRQWSEDLEDVFVSRMGQLPVVVQAR
ncbi:cytochrome P450 [Phanerochaete sordida]|uniref:Cytochrome P450 n=1 Tax=Phanerochaete sordida TaxID=48140 RepID=A0A9P3G2N0_9APHY|nr:cytochrome P450 [Phanerochaete sordida]